MKRIIFVVLIFLLNLLLVSNFAYGQCAMCKQNVTNSEEGMKLASGLNDGIVYLLVVPYLIFAGFAITIYVASKRRRVKEINLN
ncbi:hypothetical protein [Candidatus Chrysopegis kryptomonas]|jgi:hypothetical protein|uniref:Uncharacterized protein n=1 Tax=Candidatus Chryseopegocella kryptomonas TaxID=1633643 RepID=A0A0P1MK03_9BACT|nr:hypothetical protein [Candidatus Chrysopegis kryptomonas]CUS95788.1 hypothetical protein JGI23_00002 [Candidatus Chrysopegis kryptomonas]